jgi:hypothetical protein
VLEPPDGEDGVEVLADELSLELVEVAVGAAAVDDEALEPALSAFLAPPGLLYKSAYQPPPLRMKPAPPET